VEKEVVESGSPKTKLEAHFVMRAGVSYSIHAGKLLIMPMFNVDFIGKTKTSLVYGVAFGMGF
jgi:hypothetical protein